MECATKAIEIAIEQEEQKAINWLESNQDRTEHDVSHGLRVSPHAPVVDFDSEERFSIKLDQLPVDEIAKILGSSLDLSI